MALPLSRGGPGASGDSRELDELEVRLLLEGIHQRHGFDFRDYAPGPLRRGIAHALAAEGVATVSGLQERVLHDPAAMEAFVAAVGVHVTALFREPAMFAAISGQAFSLLRTYPSVRVWLAGCATGQEVYSLAVLLEEAGLLKRCRLYATDMNALALAAGRRGTYPFAEVTAAAGRYRQAGGRGELTDHVLQVGGRATFADRLRSRVTWAEHNLVTDASFNDFHLVVCSNVLFYFGRELQDHVYRLLDESIVPGGFLALSDRESLGRSPVQRRYRRVVPGASVFQKGRA
jgi:chemotaxis protein methyltransferase CheR